MNGRAAPSRAERLRAARLYVLATTALARGPIERAVELALLGGASIVQVREKSMSDAEALALARRLRGVCDALGALLVVNDRIEVARDAGADGVHLGQTDRPVAEARRILGPGAIVGVSTHDDAELDRALRDGADHVGVGSVFSTATKGAAVRVSGPVALAPIAARAEAAGVPAFAIGGITPENVAQVVAAGFVRVAVSAGVIAADDPRRAASRIAAALRGG